MWTKKKIAAEEQYWKDRRAGDDRCWESFANRCQRCNVPTSNPHVCDSCAATCWTDKVKEMNQ